MFAQIEDLLLADPRVVVIGSDLGAGLFATARRTVPDRFFMEGIQEQHLIGMAAGLAMEGFVPYVLTISTFLTRRCLEQVIVDVALHNVPVRLLGTGGGLAYAALGPTHAAVDDFALVRAVPGMTVLAPALTDEAISLLRQSVDHPRPLYMRLPRGDEEYVPGLDGAVLGTAVVMRKPGDVLIVSTGQATLIGLEAAKLLEKRGITAGVLHVHTVKPMDHVALLTHARAVHLVITLEEHKRDGGLGTAVLETLHDAGLPTVPRVVRLGLPDEFISGYGSREDQLEKYGLNPIAVADAALADGSLYK